MYERFIELFRLRGELGGYLYFDTGLSQDAKAPAGDERIGILHRRDHFADAGGDDRFGARSRAAEVRTRLQVDVQRGSARLLSGLLQRPDFRMLLVRVGVDAAAHHLPVAYQQRAHHGIGTGPAAPLPRQFQSLAHVGRVHCSKMDWIYFSGSNGSRSSTFSPMPT